ncbi:uncharacterized protein LOC107627495 [Arachis ipaensis]|uniref:uncharacterized protein LOC107627495 n=1 Tax=Arachis ipaensis TaxID=130454 RepID=UPI0007AF229D|nr:uncharacterized protein LOC107627495 [Arachis ipaensis]
MEGLFKDFGYIQWKDFYWGKPDARGGVALKLLRLDRDVVNMYEDAIRNDDRVIHVYWEHTVDTPTEAEVVDVDVEEVPTPETANVNAESVKSPGGRKRAQKSQKPTRILRPRKLTTTLGQKSSQNYHQYESEELHSPYSSDCDSEYEAERNVWPQENPNAAFGLVHLELGMEFETMEQFKRAVRKFNIQIGRSIMFSRVEPLKCKAICCEPNCPWSIYCSRSNEPRSFQVKTFVTQHVCARSHTNKSADRKWVIEQLEEKLRDQRDFKTSEAEDWFRREFNVTINYKKIQRAMKKARENIEGSEREQYAELRDYILALLIANPGATIDMDTTPMPDSLPIFKRLYICFDACKKGFIQGCRPFIGLDGTFLKGYYGGQLLTAVGQDANNQIFPIAYAVVDSETRDNWRWFLELLHRDLGNYRVHGWNFMSDQYKGLIPAMEQVMPGVHHRFCAMHIWANFTKRWKDKQLKGAVWECCRATTVTEFEAAMMRLKGINNAAWEYLDRLDPKTWTKAHFSEWPKVDNVTNNNCETFNGKILKYRSKPIITMLEEVRVHVMRVMARNKKYLSGYVGDDNGKIYEVEKHPIKVTVDLGNQKCTCRFWQLTGLPCRHACAALALRGRRPEDQIHNWLGMAAYNSAYQHNINPVPRKEFWEKAEGYPPLPPHYKTPIRRPTKKRRKEKNEARPSSNPHKLKRRYGTISCKYCGESGHNSRGCEKNRLI